MISEEKYGQIKGTIMKACAYCGQYFPDRYGLGKIYCSRSCSDKAFNKRFKERNPILPIKTKCARCNNEFEYIRNRTKRKYCFKCSDLVKKEKRLGYVSKYLKTDKGKSAVKKYQQSYKLSDWSFTLRAYSFNICLVIFCKAEFRVIYFNKRAA